MAASSACTMQTAATWPKFGIGSGSLRFTGAAPLSRCFPRIPRAEPPVEVMREDEEKRPSVEVALVTVNPLHAIADGYLRALLQCVGHSIRQDAGFAAGKCAQCRCRCVIGVTQGARQSPLMLLCAFTPPSRLHRVRHHLALPAEARRQSWHGASYSAPMHHPRGVAMQQQADMQAVW